MKKIKHSKFKNTGFLFEILTRQITLEVLNGSEEKAKGIIKEFFAGKTELAKELRLFNLLINEKYNSESKAEKFIDAILEAHSKIEYSQLKREKYNLVKSIRETLGVGTLTDVPSNLPFNSGRTSPTAFAAPVEVGIIEEEAVRDLWRSS